MIPAKNEANYIQFLPNHADIQAILPTHELVILTKFHNNWIKIVDFIFGLTNFWASNRFCITLCFFEFLKKRTEII